MQTLDKTTESQFISIFQINKANAEHLQYELTVAVQEVRNLSIDYIMANFAEINSVKMMLEKALPKQKPSYYGVEAISIEKLREMKNAAK